MKQGISYAIAPTDYTSQEGYENAVPMAVGNGEYCSVTVTNHNSYPLLFTLGRAYNQGSDEIHTHHPAGQTVTRTVKFEKDPDALTNPCCWWRWDTMRPSRICTSPSKRCSFQSDGGECPLEQILRAGTGQLLRCTVE